jgi:hypothetical protein
VILGWSAQDHRAGSDEVTGPNAYTPHPGDQIPVHTPPAIPEVTVDPGIIPPPVTGPPPPPPPPSDDVRVNRDYQIDYNERPPPVPAEPSDRMTSTLGPSSKPLRVSLSSLQSVERSLLSNTADVGEEQASLAGEVSTVRDTIFGQNAMYFGPRDHDYNSQNLADYAYVWQPDPLQESAKAFAEMIKPAMDVALQNCALTLQLIGAFIKNLEAAGDGYAMMDEHSRFTSDDPTA